MSLGPDLHSALKVDALGTSVESGVHATLVRLQQSKTDVSFSVHVKPNQFSFSGLQLTDLLSYLGFTTTDCPFHNGGGYCRFVSQDFDLTGFVASLGNSYTALQEADRLFRDCGFLLPQPEGWGHFYGQGASTRRRPVVRPRGDGHNSPTAKQLKHCADDNLEYSLTWLEGGSDKGWTTHYHPKAGTVSEELEGVFDLLELEAFPECPEFDFEQCRWRFMPFEPRGGFNGNADSAHAWFDAHETKFSRAVEKLLAAHGAMEPHGIALLNFGKPPSERQQAAIARKTSLPAKRPKAKIDDETFDVAISFAGTNRMEAERLAALVREAGFSVFYDNFFAAELWGKNLADLFDSIYRKRAKHCVIFVSQDYLDREWTNHERQSAQARALKEKGAEYILPIKVEDVELPGMAPTIGYVSLADLGIEKIAALLLEKLKQ